MNDTQGAKYRGEISGLVVGLGHRMSTRLLAHPVIGTVAAVDPDHTRRSVAKKARVGFVTNLDEALRVRLPGFAVVAVPHAAYRDVLERLAGLRVPTLKEKPLGTSLADAKVSVGLTRRATRT